MALNMQFDGEYTTIVIDGNGMKILRKTPDMDKLIPGVIEYTVEEAIEFRRLWNMAMVAIQEDQKNGNGGTPQDEQYADQITEMLRQHRQHPHFWRIIEQIQRHNAEVHPDDPGHHGIAEFIDNPPTTPTFNAFGPSTIPFEFLPGPDGPMGFQVFRLPKNHPLWRAFNGEEEQ